jgi:hypothetical protein
LFGFSPGSDLQGEANEAFSFLLLFEDISVHWPNCCSQEDEAEDCRVDDFAGKKKFPENEFLSTKNHRIKHILERTCANNAPLKVSKSKQQEQEKVCSIKEVPEISTTTDKLQKRGICPGERRRGASEFREGERV